MSFAMERNLCETRTTTAATCGLRTSAGALAGSAAFGAGCPGAFPREGLARGFWPLVFPEAGRGFVVVGVSGAYAERIETKNPDNHQHIR